MNRLIGGLKKGMLVWLCLVSLVAEGQTNLNKVVPVKAGQNVRFNFDYPEMIRVTTWDKNEISIQCSVSINGGENDDAFGIDVNATGSTVDITGKIKDMDNLPQRITIVRDGVKTTFRSKSEWQKYKKESGKGSFEMMNQGIDMDIEINIMVPVNMATSVVSVYGMVEVKNFKGPLKVEATYGGVDAALTESETGELIAETNYGHIYTDLNVKFDDRNTRDEDFHMVVSAKPGTGPAYRFESPYGNVYLRKNSSN